MDASVGNRSNPRINTMLAGCCCANTWRACATNVETASAVALEAGSCATASIGRTPVFCGSVSDTLGPRCSPRNTSKKRCSFTGLTNTSMPLISICCNISASAAQRCDEIRPARLSVTIPLSSTVQKLPRAATSLGCRSKSTPSAVSTPRPISTSRGS